MKTNTIAATVIGSAALIAALGAQAGQYHYTAEDWDMVQTLRQIEQTPQAKHQAKMQEWARGLGFNLPGADYKLARSTEDDATLQIQQRELEQGRDGRHNRDDDDRSRSYERDDDGRSQRIAHDQHDEGKQTRVRF